jgi:hypothetical protein
MLLASQLAYTSDLARVGKAPKLNAVAAPPTDLAPARNGAPPPAIKAMPRAVSKSGPERPVVAALTPGIPAVNSIDDATWQAIAALHVDDAKLSPQAAEVVRRKALGARAASAVSTSKRIQEDPLVRTLANLQRSIAEDTVRNEYMLHARIHEWFAARLAVMTDLEMLNDRVYADLFLSPNSDPWLGLAPADTFTALDGEGLLVSDASKN